MADTVNDFMRRFGGNDTIDDREAEHYYDRFASTHADDRDFDNETMYRGTTEYLGQLPDEQFEHAARNAYEHAPHAQQQGLWGSLLRALQGRGVSLGSLQNQLGLSGLDPSQIGPDEYGRVANYTRRNYPEVMEAQVREQSWLVKAMGSPIVMGALGMIAAKLIGRK